MNNIEYAKVTPENITHLRENEIFVFGSNEGGRHGAGAAKLARDKWGAEYGNPVGLQGQTYAIPTKDKTVKFTLSVEQIRPYVDQFIEFVKNNPQYMFLVTEVGCGLAGHTPENIAPLFREAVNLENIRLPMRFIINLCIDEVFNSSDN